MGWFNKLCRNAGLMVHNMADPYGDKPACKVISKKVERDQISPTVTLRKTTIEEIEVKREKGAVAGDKNDVS